MRTRLNELINMVEDHYYEVWDTCCDHGKLGISILNNRKVKKVHFVDCVPEIMTNLESKIKGLGHYNSPRVELHTLKAEDIILSDRKSLICICGVGGVTAIDIIGALLKHNDLNNHDILLCVQYKTPRLRRFLMESGFKAQKEMLCFEGKWAHEIIRISLGSGYEIDLVGTPMFNKDNKKHLKHLNKSIEHYIKKSANNKEYKVILDLYKSI